MMDYIVHYIVEKRATQYIKESYPVYKRELPR
jgi:hypothetical protein